MGSVTPSNEINLAHQHMTVYYQKGTISHELNEIPCCVLDSPKIWWLTQKSWCLTADKEDMASVVTEFACLFLWCTYQYLVEHQRVPQSSVAELQRAPLPIGVKCIHPSKSSHGNRHGNSWLAKTSVYLSLPKSMPLSVFAFSILRAYVWYRQQCRQH